MALIYTGSGLNRWIRISRIMVVTCHISTQGKGGYGNIDIYLLSYLVKHKTYLIIFRNFSDFQYTKGKKLLSYLM